MIINIIFSIHKYIYIEYHNLFYIILMDPTALLNPTLPFDQNKVQILDQLVTIFYGPNSPQRPIADKILNDFKAAPESWGYTDLIVEHSANPNSKFLALSILEEAINVSELMKLITINRPGGKFFLKDSVKAFETTSGKRFLNLAKFPTLILH